MEQSSLLSEYILNFIHQWTFGYSEQYQIFYNYYQLNINNIKSIQDWFTCIISDEFPTYLSNSQPFNNLCKYIAKCELNVLEELFFLIRNCDIKWTSNEELLQTLREFNIIRENNLRITTRLSLFFLNSIIRIKRSIPMAKLFKFDGNSILENGELNLFSTDQWFYFQLLLTMRISIILTENYDYFFGRYWNNEYKCNIEYCYQASFENSIKNCYSNAIVSHSNNQNEYLTHISINGFEYKFRHVVKYSKPFINSVPQGLEFKHEIEGKHDNNYIHLYWVGGKSLRGQQIIPKYSNVIVFYHEITQLFHATVVQNWVIMRLCTRSYLDLQYQLNLNGNISINDKLLNKNEIKNWNHEIIYSIIHNELGIPTETTIFDECNGNDLCEMIENCFICYDLLENHKNSIIDKVLKRHVNIKYGNSIYNRMLMEWLFDNFTKLIV